MDSLSFSSVNWPLFIITSLIVFLSAYAPSICLWLINHFCQSSTSMSTLISELSRVTRELTTISQQNEFAAYVRKQREQNSLRQRLKDEQNRIEMQQKSWIIRIRIGTILAMIILSFNHRRQESMPLFNFSFFHFPLIIWMMALNTFISSLKEIYTRYRVDRKNKISTE